MGPSYSQNVSPYLRYFHPAWIPLISRMGAPLPLISKSLFGRQNVIAGPACMAFVCTESHQQNPKLVSIMDSGFGP